MSAPCSRGRVRIGVAAVEFDRQQAPGGVDDPGRLGDAENVEEGVRGRLDDDERRAVGVDHIGQALQRGAVESDRVTVGEPFGQHLRAVVRPPLDGDARAARGAHQRGHRRQAGGEQRRVLGPLQRRDHRFGFACRRAVRAPVDVAGGRGGVVHITHERGRRLPRTDDPASCRIVLAVGVGGYGLAAACHVAAPMVLGSSGRAAEVSRGVRWRVRRFSRRFQTCRSVSTSTR